jgi:aldose 1-epimerase
MNFSIQNKTENGLQLVRITDHISKTYADILPEHGATLHRFTIETRSGTHNVIDNYSDRRTIESEMDFSFKGPKLSPFVCRIPNGRYKWNNSSYEFAKKFKDGSAIHGLLYNKKFDIIEKAADDTHGSVQLEYRYDKDDSGYPFQYSCRVIYTLYAENLLEVLTIITNLSDETIPVADGWHPYFKLGTPVNKCQLRFASTKMLEFDAALIPTGKILKEESFSRLTTINDRFLDNCFVLDPVNEQPVCTLQSEEKGLRLQLFADSNYPFLQVFTPDHRNSIAIENLSSAPDSFNNGIGLKKIAPGESESFTAKYQLTEISA